MKTNASNSLLLAANAYIFIAIIYYWVETAILLNPVAIGLLLGFGIHLFVAKNNSRYIFPSLFILINAYMFLALFSEFGEFNSLRTDAALLMIVGILYLGLNIASTIVIIHGFLSTDHLQLKVNSEV